MDNIIELYGAITILTIMIGTIENDIKNNKFMPGSELLLGKLKELSNQMNVEVAEFYNESLTNLYKAALESDEDE